MKVLLIDDHALFRDGVLLVLKGMNEALETFEAGSFNAAKQLLAEQHKLDLVLLDLGLPGVTYLDALIYIRQQFPDLPVVVLSGTEEHSIVEHALRLGAKGYIPKSSSAKIMLSALQLVIAGGIYVPPEIMKCEATNIPQATMRDAQSPVLHESFADNNVPYKLTQRQGDVLREMAKGKSNKAIGMELHLTESTVRVHVSAIFKSFGVANRTQAVRYAVQRGWVNND